MIQLRYQNVLGVPLALILAGFMLNGYNYGKLFQHFYQNFSMKAELDRYADAQLADAFTQDRAPVEISTSKDPIEEEGLYTTHYLAMDFVKWHMQQSFDFDPLTADSNHVDAVAWMTNSSAHQLEKLFWKPSKNQLINFASPDPFLAGGEYKTGIYVHTTASFEKILNDTQSKSISIQLTYRVKMTKDGLRVMDVQISDGDKKLIKDLME